MATLNSRPIPAARMALFLGIVLVAGYGAMADGTNDIAGWARKEFHRTQIHYQSDTNNAAAAWEFARACFNYVDFVTNTARHASIARLGIAASRQAIALEPDSVAGHYYLGLNDGELARVETLGALRLVRQMEREFKTAYRLDSRFDDAGPERTLGLLYRDAPGWPVSIGSRRKALQWLQQAEKTAPASPENHLNLIETYLQWHQRSDAEREMRGLDVLWPIAKTKLTGQAWAQCWADWTARRDAAKSDLGQTIETEKSSKTRHDP